MHTLFVLGKAFDWQIVCFFNTDCTLIIVFFYSIQKTQTLLDVTGHAVNLACSMQRLDKVFSYLLSSRPGSCVDLLMLLLIIFYDSPKVWWRVRVLETGLLNSRFLKLEHNIWLIQLASIALKSIWTLQYCAVNYITNIVIGQPWAEAQATLARSLQR